MKKIAPLFLFLLFLISCSTTRPFWLDNPSSEKGKINYVVKGSGEGEESAREDAINNIISRLEEDLATPLPYSAFRELYSFKYLKTPSSIIKNEFLTTEDGKTTLYINLEVDEKEFSSYKNPILSEINERDGRIEEKLSQSLDEYKNNKDLLSITSILEGILISSEGEVSKENECEKLLKAALEKLDKLYISVKNVKNTDDISLTLSRKKGIFNPKVEDGYLLVKYNQMAPNTEKEEREYILRTDSDGNAVYKRMNPYSLYKDKLKIYPYIDRDLLYKIELSLGEDFLIPLYEKIESKAVEYEVEYHTEVDLDEVIILYSEHDISGEESKDVYIPLSINRVFNGVFLLPPRVERGEGEDEEEILKNALDDYEGYNFYIVLRSGVTSYDIIDNKYYARSEGNAIFYNKEKDEKKTISDLHFVSPSDSEKEAGERSLKMIGEVIAFRVLGEF